jgi:hypothetical protein
MPLTFGTIVVHIVRLHDLRAVCKSYGLGARAGEGMRAEQEPHGVEQNLAFLQAPVMVNSRLLQQPERREALGMFLCLTLLWRLGESAAVSLRKVGTRHCGSRRSTRIPVYLKTPERPLCLAVAPGCRSARARSQCRGCGSETG